MREAQAGGSHRAICDMNRTLRFFTAHLPKSPIPSFCFTPSFPLPLLHAFSSNPALPSYTTTVIPQGRVTQGTHSSSNPHPHPSCRPWPLSLTFSTSATMSMPLDLKALSMDSLSWADSA